ncbi:MAG: LysR family transcriptional regulator [Pseudomonadota bacterium]|nr:LysR family transcriptional regulator [Pseudomonadota bacterium]
MSSMSDFDHLDLDGHALRLFLAVLEEGSVGGAAARLGLTQSAVSHALAKLRAILHDPLFVKSGRGIVATAHARALADPARALVAGLKDFSRAAEFDARATSLALTVAANDLQRDLVLPGLLAALQQTFASVRLRIIPSDQPTPDMLRDERCDLVISPFPPEGVDILQKRLFGAEYVCFYDAAARATPTAADYYAADHVTVVYTSRVGLRFDRAMEAAGHARRFVVGVPNFAGVPAFLRGTARLATLPSGLAASVMRGFASRPLPVRVEGAAFAMFMAWHRRHALDPAHRLVRTLLSREAGKIARAPGKAGRRG